VRERGESDRLRDAKHKQVNQQSSNKIYQSAGLTGRTVPAASVHLRFLFLWFGLDSIIVGVVEVTASGTRPLPAPACVILAVAVPAPTSIISWAATTTATASPASARRCTLTTFESQ
jgi:hypothetical protein